MEEKKAYCYSYACTGSYDSHHSTAVIKDVRFGKTDCPQCGSVLVWRKKHYRIKVLVNKEKIKPVYGFEQT